MTCKEVIVTANPNISPDQLWDFYVRNDICEVGFGKEIAVKPLYNSSLIIGAFNGDKLVGIARAMFDGLSAVIMEFCLELELQGTDLIYENGSLIEKDSYCVGKRMGEMLIYELIKMGATFISYNIVENCEEGLAETLGFTHNRGSQEFVIDKRPYVINEK